MTLLDLFDGSLAERADAPAVNGVTHRALHLGALRVARRFADRGLRPGDRLSLYCENRIGFVYAYLAALRSGVIAVPTNVLYRSVDLHHVLDDADVRAVMVSAQTAPHLEHSPDRARETIHVDEVEAWAVDERIAPLEVDAHQIAPGDVAVLIYTSGTTGRSKGAELTHDNLATIAIQLAAAWRWTAADRLVIALPLFHLHGLAAALNTTLAVGAQITIHERFDARTIMRTLRESGATMFFGVPTMYVRLLELSESEAAPRLRLFVSGSAALPADVHRAFERRFGAVILERYGATEFGFPLTNRFGGPRVPGSVGVPMPGTAVRIAAPDGVAPLADGEVGELLVSGPTVCAGYWRNPEATRAAFVSDESGRRWYRSGDLARHDPEADVYQIVGRIKELIISGGFNVYPREIETEIDRYPGVRASAVVGAPDPARGELPVAFIECEREVDAEALIAHLRESLASFKVPKAVRVVDALPRNALGKVEKQRLRAMLVAETAAAVTTTTT